MFPRATTLPEWNVIMAALDHRDAAADPYRRDLMQRLFVRGLVATEK
jgi:hypothetical protein